MEGAGGARERRGARTREQGERVTKKKNEPGVERVFVFRPTSLSTSNSLSFSLFFKQVREYLRASFGSCLSPRPFAGPLEPL